VKYKGCAQAKGGALHACKVENPVFSLESETFKQEKNGKGGREKVFPEGKGRGGGGRTSLVITHCRSSKEFDLMGGRSYRVS